MKVLEKGSKKKVNIRWQIYKKERLSGKTQYDSAIAAGYSRSVALTACQKLENKVNFSDFMRKAGITDEKLANKINEGLEATKRIPATKYQDSEEVPDYTAQHNFTETALKLKGHLRDADNAQPQINIFLGNIVDRAEGFDKVIDTTAKEI